MIGKTIMEVSQSEMIAIVQYYLNNDLLNTAFQTRHKSIVEDVRQRSSGRFVIEFIPAETKQPNAPKKD